jgi:hypothetical protein
MPDIIAASPDAPALFDVEILGTVTVTGAGIRPVMTPAGGQSGFQLPDGRVVKPWIAWELLEADAEEGVMISDPELEALGVGLVDYATRELTEVESEDPR